jgi:hypothetical protein
MKTNAIVRIILFSLAILILLGILIGGLGIGTLVILLGESSVADAIEEVFTIDDSVSVDGTGSSGRYDASQINNLEINWVSGTIVIQPGDTDTIRFEESAVSDEKYQLSYKKSGDRLVIQFCEESHTSWKFGVNINKDISKDLVITVPQHWICNSLEINTASARVEIRDLTIREVDFDGASGVFNLDQCIVDELDIDTASGDVEFSGELSILDFDAASANFYGVFLNVPKRMNVDSMSGDLDITLPENCGFSVSMDSMSSNFSSDFPTTVSNGNYVYGDQRCNININGMSSDATIRKGK